MNVGSFGNVTGSRCIIFQRLPLRRHLVRIQRTLQSRKLFGLNYRQQIFKNPKAALLNPSITRRHLEEHAPSLKNTNTSKSNEIPKNPIQSPNRLPNDLKSNLLQILLLKQKTRTKKKEKTKERKFQRIPDIRQESLPPLSVSIFKES